MHPTPLENSCRVCAYVPIRDVPIQVLPSFIPEDAINRLGSALGGFGATWLYLGAEERTLSRSLQISRGRLHPVWASVAHMTMADSFIIPTLNKAS
jgi:hypothetical protein